MPLLTSSTLGSPLIEPADVTFEARSALNLSRSSVRLRLVGDTVALGVKVPAVTDVRADGEGSAGVRTGVEAVEAEAAEAAATAALGICMYWPVARFMTYFGASWASSSSSCPIESSCNSSHPPSWSTALE